MIKKLRKFMQDEEGLTVVEYAVAGALITVAVAGTFTTLGQAVVTQMGLVIAAL